MRWKRVEREIAKRLDGTRVPLLGRKGTDLDTPVWFIEVKSRKSIGAYLWDDFLAQILEGAEEMDERDKIPSIAIHRPGMDYDDALECFRAGDYHRLIHRILSVYPTTTTG